MTRRGAVLLATDTVGAGVHEKVLVVLEGRRQRRDADARHTGGRGHRRDRGRSGLRADLVRRERR